MRDSFKRHVKATTSLSCFLGLLISIAFLFVAVAPAFADSSTLYPIWTGQENTQTYPIQMNLVLNNPTPVLQDGGSFSGTLDESYVNGGGQQINVTGVLGPADAVAPGESTIQFSALDGSSIFTGTLTNGQEMNGKWLSTGSSGGTFTLNAGN